MGGWGAPHFLVGHLPADASGPARSRLFLSPLHEESQASVIVRILQVGKQAQEAERAAQGHAAFRFVRRLFQAREDVHTFILTGQGNSYPSHSLQLQEMNQCVAMGRGREFGLNAGDGEKRASDWP